MNMDEPDMGFNMMGTLPELKHLPGMKQLKRDTFRTPKIKIKKLSDFSDKNYRKHKRH